MFARVVLALAIAGCARGSGESTGDGPPAPVTDAFIDSNGCSVQPCSVLPACGCTGNTTCDVDISDNEGTACRTINLEGTETATCTNSMECDRGYVCLGDQDFASCKKYCTADADCGAPRGQCIYTVTSANGQPIADIPKVCSSNCEPTDTSAALCPSVYKCTLFVLQTGSSTVDVADCSPAGAGTQGASCDQAGSAVEEACAKGYQCVQFGANPFKCARICNTAAPSCPNNTSCNAFTTPIVVGGVNYGVCGP